MSTSESARCRNCSGINLSQVLAGITLTVVLAATAYAIRTSFKVTNHQSEMAALNTAAIASPLPLGSDSANLPLQETPRLQPPALSLPLAGPEADRIAVSIENPNPAGSSVLYYSIDHGIWEVYEGERLFLGTDSVLKARAVSNIPGVPASREIEKSFTRWK